MKVMVIGLGSMGKRRIRLLKQIDPSIFIVGVDARKDRREEAQNTYELEVADSIEEGLRAHPDVTCAIISTSPLSHADIITECLNHKLNVFTELNLVADGYKKNIRLAKENNRVLFLSSTFLYRDEVRYIKKLKDEIGGKWNYTYHIGQYLPDWHPWENINDFFVGNKRTNGCREIMAIEFPWLINVFGKIRNVTAFGGKLSALEVDYPDNYQMVVEHENGNRGVLSVDVVSRRAVRNLEVYGEGGYISWDGSATGLYSYDIEQKENKNINLYEEIDHQEGYSAFVVENAYKAELLSFLEAVEKGEQPVYGFEEDYEILSLIDNIELQTGRN